MLPLGVFEQSIRRSKVFRAFIAESTRRMDSEFGFDIIFLYGAVEFGLNFFISSCIVKCYVVLLVLTWERKRKLAFFTALRLKPLSIIYVVLVCDMFLKWICLDASISTGQTDIFTFVEYICQSFRPYKHGLVMSIWRVALYFLLDSGLLNLIIAPYFKRFGLMDTHMFWKVRA